MINEQLMLENNLLRTKIVELENECKCAREQQELSEDMWKSIINAIPHPAWIKDIEGRFLSVNAPWLEHVGLQHEDCIEKTVFEVFPRELAQTRHDEDLEVVTSGKHMQLQVGLKNKTGTAAWFETIKGPLKTGKGAVLGTLGFSRDISEQKRAELSLERTHRALRMLITCNEVLVRSEKEQDLVHNICSIIAGSNGYLDARIWYKENDAAKTARMVAHSGYMDWFTENLEITWDNTLETGRGPSGTAIREGVSCLIKDCQKDPRCAPWRETLQKHGYTSVLSIPLICSEEIIGALTVYTSVPDAFEDEEVELLMQLAKEIAYGIESLRTAAEYRRSTEALANSEYILAEAQAIAHLGSWEYDMVKDEEYRSAEFYRILGQPPQENGPATDSVFDYIHPGDREDVLNKLVDALEKWKKYDVQYRIVRRDGVTRFVHAQGKTITNQDGKPAKFIGTVQDVSERIKLEEKEQQLVAFVENSSELIGIASLSGEITYVNSAGMKMIGAESLEEINNLPLSSFLDYHDQEEPLKIYQAILQRGYWRGELELHNYANGYSFPVEATGFIIKDKRTGIPTGIAAVCRNISRRKRNETAIRESEARFRSLVETTTDWIWETDEHSVYTYASPKIRDLLGYEPEEIVGKPFFDLVHPENVQRFAQEFEAITSSRKTFSGVELVRLHKNENLVTIETSGVPVFDDEGKFRGYRGIDRDVSSRKKLEHQLLHSQKMEAVGQLAGGVAHDFNNILTAIIGYQHLLSARIDDQKGKHYLEQLATLADKASALTQDLLTFSRKQGTLINPKIKDLNSVVNKSEKLLKRLIGEDIEFEAILHEGTLSVIVVANQIEQVLMNLATNARDAMPNGGSLCIKTDVMKIDGAFLEIFGFETSGMYAVLSVSDSGIGMEEQVRSRVFEPFFTTKEVGSGTGLGLATAYGIIKQHNGYIKVYSEPGEGTTFKIYLPLVEAVADEVDVALEKISAKMGTETILLAEDEKEVREIIIILLANNGYNVIEAVDGDDALEKFVAHEAGLDLLITDVIMPKRSGKEVYDIINKAKPGMKTIFMSGYTGDIVERKSLPETCHLITKPFSPHVFLQKIRDVLDGAN